MVTERGYQLLDLPFGEAMALRDNSVHDVSIPAYTYSVVPPVPEQPVHTVAPWLSVIAGESVPDESVVRLLEAIFDGDFALRGELPALDATAVVRHRELTLHPGTVTYLSRNQPLITGEFIEGVENLRSFLVSALIAGVLLWRWYRRRGAVGFERHLDALTRLEQEVGERCRSGRLDRDAAREFEERLTRIKSDALELFSSGRLSGAELLDSFLMHAADVRSCLHWQAAEAAPRATQAGPPQAPGAQLATGTAPAARAASARPHEPDHDARTR
jgi:hypothetical protein